MKVKIGKTELASPLIAASGTFSFGLGDFIDWENIGAVTSKTVTFKPKNGNEVPRIAEVGTGMLNSIGLQNPGIDEFTANEIEKYLELPIPLIVSYSGETSEEFVYMTEKLNQFSEILAYELNVSCPNVKKGGIEIGSKIEVVEEVVREVKAVSKKPIIVKLSPNTDDIVKYAEAAEKSGADALALINTLIGSAIDIYAKKPKIKMICGGYSGPGIKPVAVAMIYKVSKALNIPIIGSGGISSWQDVIEFALAGANAAAVGTDLLVNPKNPAVWIPKIEEYLEKNNISWNELSGFVSRNY